MLELPKIKVGDFEETLLGLANKIPEMNSEWQNLSESSVGIMLLELLTYLNLEQRKNMNKISGESLINLGRLFGEIPLKTAPSNTIAAFSCEPQTIHKFTKLYANSLVFETESDCIIDDNRVINFGKSDSENYFVPYSSEADAQLELHIFNDSDTLIIGFAKPFDYEKEVKLVLCLNENLNRKMPQKMSEFIIETEVVWQYYGVENDVTDWFNVRLISDETYALFRTGMIKFELRGTHKEINGVFPIRCVLRRNCFDILPVITGAYLHTSPIVQTDTKCISENFTLEMFEKNRMTFSNAMAEKKIFKLFVNTKKGFRNADELDISFDVIYENNSFRLVTSSRKMLSEIFAELDETDKNEVMKLVIYSQDYVRDFTEYVVENSSSNQQIQLNFNGLFGSRTRIMAAKEINGEQYWQPWEYVEKLSLATPSAKVFTVDAENGLLIFGDNIHGAVPKESLIKNLIVTDMALTNGVAGNIVAGRLNFDHNETFETADNNIKKAVKADRIVAAIGGTNAEKPNEFLQRILTIKRFGTLITETDFIDRTINTDGLLIENAKAFPTPKVENSITVVIEPAVKISEIVENNDETKLDWYLKNVYNNLMKYHPLTLEIEVRFPLYIPISADVQIETSSFFVDVEQTVRRQLEQFFAAVSDDEIDYNEVLRNVSEIDGISQVIKLELITNNAARLHNGSISIPPHGKAYLKHCRVISRNFS